MDIEALTAADATAATAEWVDLPKHGIKLQVLATTAPAVQREYRRLSRRAPASDRDDAGMLLPDAETSVLRAVLGDIALVDWEGIKANGEPLPFSRDKAQELVKADLFLDLVEQASILAAIRHKVALDGLVKN